MEGIIDRLIDAIEDFLQIDQDAVDWEIKPSTNKWSKKEIIGHLIDSAQVNLQRFIRCTYQEDFKMVYAQDEFVAATHYQDADIKEILDLWILINRQIIRVLSNYPLNRIGIQCDTGKNEVSLHSVDWLAADYVDHVKHHLAQVG